MPRKRITFGQSKEITNPPDDFRSFLFPFCAVDADLVGAPEEAQKTSEHKLIVIVAKNRLPSWGPMNDGDLRKVLFEIGRREIEKLVKTVSLQREHKVVVGAEARSRIRPYDPDRLHEAGGAFFEIEEDQRKIGF